VDVSQKADSKHGRLDLIIRAATPIVAGLLIAFAGYVSERTLTSISMKQENARLITNLQIQREQAESNLRKDIFDQALKALLNDEDSSAATMGLSKRLLKLELLALNFGDSLSLAPLFSEFARDLDRIVDSAMPGGDEHQRAAVLRKRLHGLARRVASVQLSSVVQHGQVATIKVKLSLEGKGFRHGRLEYKWPEDEIWEDLGGRPAEGSADFAAFTEAHAEEMAKRGWIHVGDTRRKVTMSLSNPDRRLKTLDIDLEIESWTAPEHGPSSVAGMTVTRGFQLHYFNFPKIDNTRLSDGQRFSIIMEKFQPKGADPEIEISAVVFPSEYASLRDRPGMQEALRLLTSVLKQQSEDE
jgi:hypothetical protein